MFEASAEFLPTRLTAVKWRVSGIAVGNGGQGAGRVFLHTLLSRNKRVWRRTGPQPRDFEFDFKVLKIFGVNRYGSLRNERNRRVSSRQTRHFSAPGQKSSQKTPPQCQRLAAPDPFHSTALGRARKTCPIGLRTFLAYSGPNLFRSSAGNKGDESQKLKQSIRTNLPM